MATYIQIGSTVTVGSGGAANIEFTSIPSTFTDIVLKISARVTGTNPWCSLTINGSSSGFTTKLLQGDGATAYSGGYSNNYYIVMADTSSQTANTFASNEIYIPNYASSAYKSFSVDFANENNGTTADISATAVLWSNTAAITSLNTAPLFGNFEQYSTASLYGILKS